MQRLAKLMRAFAKLICILFIDFITLQTIVERYEMKISIRICCSIIIFLLLLLATMWLDKEKNDDEIVTKTARSVILIICLILTFLGTLYLHVPGNSEIEAMVSYVGYKAPWLVGVSDSENRMRVLEESVRLSPKNITYNIEYAYALLQQKRYDEAETYANKIVNKLDSENADGYAIRGICYFFGYEGADDEEEYNTLAYNDLKKAIEYGNTQIKTYYCYGWLCYFHRQDYKEAEEVFRRATQKIELWPDSSADSSLIAYSYYYYAKSRFENEGQFDYVQEDALEKAISIREKSDFYIHLGYCYCQDETSAYNSKAKDCFDNAVLLSPNIYTHEWRGWFYAYKLLRPEEAKEDYQYIIDYYMDNELPDDDRVRTAISFINSH